MMAMMAGWMVAKGRNKRRRPGRNSQTMSVKFYSMAKMEAKQIIEVVWPAKKSGA